MIPWRWVIAAAAIIVLVVVFVQAARGHDWYDPACCSGQDCRALDPDEYRLKAGGWELRNLHGAETCEWKALSSSGLWDGKNRVRISPDFSMHGCFANSGKGCTPLCIYVGGGV